MTGIKIRLQFETVNKQTLVLSMAIPDSDLQQHVYRHDRLSQQQRNFLFIDAIENEN